MTRERRPKVAPYVVVIGFALLGGSAIWIWGTPTSQTLAEGARDPDPVVEELSRTKATWHPASREYVTALQEGRCGPVLRRTWWIKERLDHVAATAGKDAIEAERDRLCRSVVERTAEGNLLSNEGIEDQYVFAPGSRAEIVAADKGRSDLAKAVTRRDWIRVEYPASYRAPRDRDGKAIRSMVVGLNMSQDGFVLKAGVKGNAEIDWERIAVYEEAGK